MVAILETIKLSDWGKDSSNRFGETVNEGGLVLYPTDTVYGLGCDPFNSEALRRLFQLKGREEGQGVLVLIPTLESLSRFTITVDPEFQKLLQTWWPGPITCLFRAGNNLPALLTGAGGKIGIRLPSDKFLTECLEAISGPLVSTSANFSKKATPGIFREVDPEIIERVDLAIDDEIKQRTESQPSTVVDLSGQAPRLVRKGAGLETVKACGI